MIEMCCNYTTTGYPNFKPRCRAGFKASLKCHSKNDCPKYSTTAGSICMAVLDEFADYPTFPKSENENSPSTTRE